MYWAAPEREGQLTVRLWGKECFSQGHSEEWHGALSPPCASGQAAGPP